MTERTCLTEDGKFRGKAADGIRYFRGIVYARCSRSALPVMERPEGIVDATGYGSVCPQLSPRLSDNSGERYDEGKLCLSVTSPEGAKKRPVMVWIHGGSFLTGGSEERRYGCERLAKAGNVVVVKISYRLGALGFLRVSETGNVNLGLEDQKAALQWIRSNIASFGGDPDNVTLFGQSAGALSIADLIATSGSERLFAKAILQSPPLGITMDAKEADKIAKVFMKKLGKDWMSATCEEMLEVQDSMKSYRPGLTFMPVGIDFMTIPEAVKNAGLKIVAGYAAQDAGIFMQKPLGRLFDTALGRAVSAWATRKIFSRPCERYLRMLKECGLDAKRYFIRWHPAGNPLKSCHCIELPFILGDREDWKDSSMLKGMTEEEFSSNSADLLKAWTTFAECGEFPYSGILEP